MIVGMEREEANTASNLVERNSDRLSWEIEPGIRFKSSANTQMTLNYFNAGKRSDKGETWGYLMTRKTNRSVSTSTGIRQLVWC